MITKDKELTEKIIKCFLNVYWNLGYGFLEKVYERALAIELKNNGLDCETQKAIKVYYGDALVGDYFADLIINDYLVIELKAQEILVPENESQLLNYLKATKYEIGLLLNFGKRPEIRRKIFNNSLK